MKILEIADRLSLTKFHMSYKADIPELGSYLDHQGLEQSLKRGVAGKLSNVGQLQALIFYQDLGDELEILLTVTAPPYRRQGLMRGLIRELRMQSAKTLWLEVSQFNQPARSLYAQLGFIQVGTRPDYYSKGESALLLSWPRG